MTTDAWIQVQRARLPAAALEAAIRHADAEHGRWALLQAATLLALLLTLAWTATHRRADGPSWVRAMAALLILSAVRLGAQLAGRAIWPTGGAAPADLLLSAIQGLAVAALLALLAYALLARLGRAWPAAVLALAIGLPLLALVWAPERLSPRLRHDQPAPATPAASRLLGLARRGGAQARTLYVYKGEDAGDCDVAGWGAEHVAVSRAMLATATSPAAQAGLAHVLAHARHHDLLKLALLCAAVWSLGGLAAGAAVLRWGSALTGAGRVADPAGLPLALLVLVATCFVLRPAYNALDQQVNLAADRFAMDLTGSADGLAAWVEAQRPLTDPAPTPVTRLLFYGHPPLEPRLEAMARWRAAALTGRQPGPGKMAAVGEPSR
jgi:STE24 endopeptidase